MDSIMEEKITINEGFCAMAKFLEKWYGFTKSDDIGSLLGDIQLLENDSGTWDCAAWNDWEVALEQKESVTAIEGFKGIFNFLMAYYIRTSYSSNDIKSLLDDMAQVQDKKPESYALWNLWKECLKNY